MSGWRRITPLEEQGASTRIRSNGRPSQKAPVSRTSATTTYALRLRRFALITDDPSKGLIENAAESLADAQGYGCGCFWFEKP